MTKLAEPERYYLVRNRWALGDTVCLSALGRDLALHTGGKSRLICVGHYPSFWKHNPYTTPIRPPGSTRITAVDLSNREYLKQARFGHFRQHFLAAWYDNFRKKTGIRVPMTKAAGDIHLARDEAAPLVNGRYWLLSAGHKSDMPVKGWPGRQWQELVDRLAARGIRCVQAGHHDPRHTNHRLTGVLDLVGLTPSIRDFFRLVRDAEGVVCGITSTMHLAAVWDKPCVVIAGGREAWTWAAYADVGANTWPAGTPAPPTPHRFLHTLTLLDCCATENGCWAEVFHKAVRRGAAEFRRPCERVVSDPDLQPLCMRLITPRHVEDAVVSYYEQGRIPPISVDNVPPALVGGLKAGAGRTGPVLPPAPKPTGLWEHPIIGGRVTIAVLCWGDHLKLARRCLESVLPTIPHDHRDVRVAANQVSGATAEYLKGLADRGEITAIHWDDGQRKKYPAMRDLLYDPARPVTTNYVIWFDDDTHVLRPDWIDQLLRTIIARHPGGGRLFGATMFHDLSPYIRQGHKPLAWFQAASWWRGRPLRLRNKQAQAPNGTCIDFIPGSFWAMDMATLRQVDWPDRRLIHRGDIACGAAVHQAGFKVESWDNANRFVKRNDSPRRGTDDPLPWAPPLKSRR